MDPRPIGRDQLSDLGTVADDAARSYDSHGPILLETVKSGIQRALLDLEHLPRHLPDPPSDAEPVHGFESQHLQDQRVQRALEQVGPVVSRPESPERPGGL